MLECHMRVKSINTAWEKTDSRYWSLCLQVWILLYNIVFKPGLYIYKPLSAGCTCRSTIFQTNSLLNGIFEYDMHRKARKGLVHVKGLKILKRFKVNERDHVILTVNRGVVQYVSTVQVPVGDATVVFTDRYFRMGLNMIPQREPGRFYLSSLPRLQPILATVA